MAFRVNRRPLGEGTLVVEKLPPDPFDHFVRMLAPGHEVITYGRGRERSWRVGAVEIDWDERFLTGKLGWHPRDPEIVPSWSQELKDWPPTAKEPPETLLPFGFDGEKRLLGVLHDKKSSPTTLAAVFEMILNENERQFVNPTTEWSVEPVLDAQEFIEWLHTQDVVEAVAFVARLPNPEPRAQFEELAERLERAHGTEYAARMKSKREEGLQNIEEDPEFRQAIAMGEEGFAQLEGRGRRGNRPTHYRQREKVASERIPKVPADWETVRAILKEMVKDRLRRFLLDDDEAA